LHLIPQWPIGAAIAELIEAMTVRLAREGLTLVVHAHSREARPVGDLWKAITPAAVINDQVLDEREQAAARRAGIPVIAPVYTVGSGSFADFQREIGRRQAEHLAALGHRRLGYAMPDDDRLTLFSLPRLEGVREVCDRLGLDEPLVRTVPLDPNAGVEAGAQAQAEAAAGSTAARAVADWNRAEPRITAVCAYNDEVALAVLVGMRAHGLSAPEDLAVIGADDIPSAALAYPPLSTLSIGMSALGDTLAQAVVNVLAGAPEPSGPGPDAIRIVRRSTT
ncbi:MAG: substrate-binding domain-containing protein, partial [Actinocrinis sp.]